MTTLTNEPSSIITTTTTSTMNTVPTPNNIDISIESTQNVATKSFVYLFCPPLFFVSPLLFVSFPFHLISFSSPPPFFILTFFNKHRPVSASPSFVTLGRTSDHLLMEFIQPVSLMMVDMLPSFHKTPTCFLPFYLNPYYTLLYLEHTSQSEFPSTLLDFTNFTQDQILQAVTVSPPPSPLLLLSFLHFLYALYFCPLYFHLPPP